MLSRIRGAFVLTMLVSSLGVSSTSLGADGQWVSLFNGKDLTGWSINELRGQGTSKWEVVDGVLVGSGQPSMLWSDKTSKNFRFRAEIRINDKGNSGMYVRTKDKPGFTDGYEIQVNSTHGDPIKTGSLYTMLHIYKQLVPPGEWFTQEVEIVDKNFRGKVVPHIKVWVNGEQLYEYLDYTKAFAEGHFAFQQHDPGSKVEIRKVEVMDLPDTK